MKVKTYIIASMTANPVGRVVKIYAETFYADIIVFICNFIMCLMSHSPIMFNIMAVDKISHGELFLKWHLKGL